MFISENEFEAIWNYLFSFKWSVHKKESACVTMTSVDTQIRNCSQIINFGFLSNCDQCTWPRKYLVPGFNHIVQGQEILKKAVCKYLQNDNSKHTLFPVLFGKHNLFVFWVEIFCFVFFSLATFFRPLSCTHSSSSALAIDMCTTRHCS